MQFRVDWISATSFECSIDRLKKAIGGKWHPVKPFNGYTEAYSNTAMTVHRHAGQPEMGVFVCIPGLSDPGQYVEKLKALGFRPSRLDIAYDTDRMTMDEFLHLLDTGHMQYSCNNANVDVRHKGVGQNKKCASVTFGSRTSNSYVRCYDKAMEQGEAGVWTRFEYEFKKDEAKWAWDNFDKIPQLCLSRMRVLAKYYKDKSAKSCKLHPTFAKIVLGVALVSGTFTILRTEIMGECKRIAKNLKIKRSRKHLSKLCTYIKTWLAADPTFAADLASAQPDPLRLQDYCFELNRHDYSRQDWHSEWLRFSCSHGPQMKLIFQT